MNETLALFAQVNVEGGVDTIVGWVASLALLAAVVGVGVAIRLVFGGKLSVALGILAGVAVFGYLMANPAKVLALGGALGGLFGI